MIVKAIIFYFIAIVSRPVLSEDELKLVHIIFSHRFNAPIKINDINQTVFPEKLEYKYFLENADTMANSAKLVLYEFGVYLRNRYKDFLGDMYYPQSMQMRTTEYILSMISAQLVNAGLWPPYSEQKWNDDLNWQPIPTDYTPAQNDSLLLGMLCPNFIKHTEEVCEKKKSDIQKYNELFSNISNHVGYKISKPSEVEMLYTYLNTLGENNLPRPKWAENEKLTYDKLVNATFLSYDLISHTSLQRKLNGGTLLRRIIDSSNEHRKSNGTSQLKITMYSVEDHNIMGVLKSMVEEQINDVASHPANGPTVRAIVFEVYGNNSKTVNATEQYFVKTFYYHNDGRDRGLLSLTDIFEPFNLPQCNDSCPLDEFSRLLEPSLPADVYDEHSLCGLNSGSAHYFSAVSLLLLSSAVSFCYIFDL